MTYPPRTIGQLAAEANNYEFTSSVSFRSWIHVTKTILRQAEIYRLDNSYEEAYVLYSRFADLVINHLSNHQNVSKTRDNKQLKSLMKNVEEALGYMAQLKPIIEENVRKYKKAEEHKLKRHLMNRQEKEAKEKLKYQQRESLHSSRSSSLIPRSDSSLDMAVSTETESTKSPPSDPEFTSAIANLRKLRTPDYVNHVTSPLSISKSWYPPVTTKDDDIPPLVPPKGPLDIKPTSGIEHRIRATTESGASLRSIFIPENLRHEFLRIAEPNTRQNLETCGILCGKLNRNAFFVSHLIIPPQYSTSDTCSTTDEEVLFEFVDSRELFILGWIHTHPTQSCFLSSIDLHTQNSYQIMLPEAVAVVCAPTQEPSWGVFRLTDPPGIDIIKACRLSSTFHPHPEKNIYRPAIPGHVSFKSQLKFHIEDLRKS